MGLTLGQAAKELGISKPTLAKHINNGRLTAAKRDDGIYDIDPSELGRFAASYRRVVPVEVATALTVEAPAAGGDSLATALAVAEERARQLEARLAEAAARAERAETAAEAAKAEASAALGKEREAWQRVAGLLEAPKRVSWWARLMG